MSIFLNSSSDPLRVFYNGAEIDRVYATVNGESSYFPVWQKETAYPQSISLMRAYNSPDTSRSESQGQFDVYLRDLTFSNRVYEISSGAVTRVLTYTSQSSSFDLKWRRYEFEGFVFQPSDVDVQMWGFGTSCTVSGMPAGFEYDHCLVFPNISHPIDFKVSPTSTYDSFDSRIAQLGTEQITCHVEQIRIPSGYYEIRGDSISYSVPSGRSDAWVYTATAGWVFQCPATVEFRKNVSSIPIS